MADINRLRSDQSGSGRMWLSDATFDFCVKFMEHELNLRSDDVFIASALFFTHLKSLADTGESLDSAWYLASGKMIGKNYLFVPVCMNDHYSMTFITDIWGATRFFHYDSMGSYHNTNELLDLLAEYIRVLRVRDPTLDLNAETFHKLNGPIQPNTYDCGIYALKAIQTILNEIKSESSAVPYLLHSFNASVWTQEDAVSYRDEMFNAGSMIYNEYEVNVHIQGTQNHIKKIEENRNSTRHNTLPDVESESKGEKVSLESFLLGLFGSYDLYLRYVPHDQDQDCIRQCYAQNLHLQDTFNARKRNINCGFFRGEFWILSRFHFHMANNWAPSSHGISCWDRLPYDYNRYPKTYGHISFAALEGPNRKLMISSSPLNSEQDNHRYILWIPHLTTCWKPIKEWTLFDTQTERFMVVKGTIRAPYLYF
jgi:hypothetical protein